jgi:hypothetical protein
MKVHPLFDINEKVWVVAERGVAASSLLELQSKLPGAEIVGYYPNGYVAQRPGLEFNANEAALRTLLHTNYNGRRAATNRRIATFRLDQRLAKAKQEYNHVQVKAAVEAQAKQEQEKRRLDLEAERLANPAEVVEIEPASIQAVVEMPPTIKPPRVRVSKVVAPPKESPVDLSAVRWDPYKNKWVPVRVPPPKFDWTEKRKAELEQLVAEKLSATEIAKRMGAPGKNSVIGACHRNGYTLQGHKGGRPIEYDVDEHREGSSWG